MKQWWEGLKPPERRWAVFIGGIVFLMLNYFFILPYVGELKRNEFRIKRATDTNEIYRAETRHKSEYAMKIREFQSGGDDVLPEDQAIDFVRYLNNHAVGNNIMMTSQGQLVTSTNDYSINQQMTIVLQANETNLVNFLYGLGATNSMMRVRTMNLHPDQSHMQLGASLTLVASYQKKMATRGTGAAPAKVAAAAPAPAPAPVRAPAPAPAPVVKPMDHTNKAVLPASMTNRFAAALARRNSTNQPASSKAKSP